MTVATPAKPRRRTTAEQPVPAPVEPLVEPPVLYGRAEPRVAPPLPEADLSSYHAAASDLGLTLLPWQDCAAHYLEAKNEHGRHLYRDVVIMVSRQQGKTEMMLPYIVAKLRDGKRVLHIAQTRTLPMLMHKRVSAAFSEDTSLLATRKTPTGEKAIWPRHGAGQEEVVLKNGGWYRIAASTSGGARGLSEVDVLIFDETREFKDDDVVAAAKPTQASSEDPITIYLSNAGEEEAVVLNDLRIRVGSDPRLAWVEWSAAPDRAPDDREGWAEANPRLGHFPPLLQALEDAYLEARLTNKMATFEIEHLCRFVPSLRDPLVPAAAWESRKVKTLPAPVRPYLAVSLDPAGRRASAAVAWREPDGSIAVRLVLDVTDDPVNTDKLGKALQEKERELRALGVGFDPMTDAALSRFVARPQSISAGGFANASARFVTAVEAGTLRWTDAAAVTDDLLWTARKVNDERGSFEAVRSRDDRPITASLAAIRAVWLASNPPREDRKPRAAVGF